jgi:hypothetical protein
VCVIDDHGTIIKQWLVQHTHDDLGQLFGELAALADPLDLPIAIERSEGLVVGLIAAAGHPVLMAEPAGFNAARPSWGSAGTKSMLGMRSCWLTTPGPTATGFAGSHRSPRQPENSGCSSAPACPWSKPEPRHRSTLRNVLASGRRSSEGDVGVMTVGLAGGIPWPGSSESAGRARRTSRDPL